MASLVLSAAGSGIASYAAGGSSTVVFAGLTASQLGAVVGAAVGSVIDQLVIFPALFGDSGDNLSQNVTIGAMAGNITMPSANYSTPIPIIGGIDRVRLAGSLIYASSIREEVLQAAQTSVSKRSGGKGGGGSSKVKTTTYVKKYEYFGSFSFMYCEGEVIYAEIYANGKLLSADYVNEAITEHTGTDAQIPDSIIEGEYGAGNAPAYRGRAYVTFRDVNLDPFGNRIPEVSVVLYPSVTSLSTFITNILTRVGFDASEIYVDAAIDSIVFHSVVLSDTLSVRNILQQLATTFDLYFTESDGKIKVGKLQ